MLADMFNQKLRTMKILLVAEVDNLEMLALQRLVQDTGLLNKILKKVEAEHSTAPQPVVKTIPVKTNRGWVKLNIKDIVYLKGYGHSVVIYYLDARGAMLHLNCGKALKKYSALVTEDGFYFTHQSFFVNPLHSRLNEKKTRFIITVKGVDHEIPVARARKDNFCHAA